MKLSTKVLIVIAALGLLYPGDLILKSIARKRQSEWAAVQGKRGSALGELLYLYHERHQAYPESLHDLVASGGVSEARYRELMFQEKPSAPRREWRYHRPENPGSSALFSGQPVTVWNCPISTYIIGHPDGSTICFGAEKLPHLRGKLDASQLNE